MAISIEERRKKDREAKRERRKDPEFREKDNKRKQMNADERFNKYKNKAIEYTGGLRCHNPKCVHIKYNEPLELCQVDFHDVISQTKTKNFSYLFRKHKWETIEKEIDNCKAIPLCSNCHNLEEYGTDEERFRDILD